MSVYDDEIALDNPVRYWKGEELPAEPPPTVAVDSSGNEGHAVISAVAELGVPGPIETDGTSFGVKEWFADADSPSGSDTDLRNNFTLEMWGRSDDLSGDQGLLTRLGQFGLGGSFCVGFNSGSIFARLSDSAGDTYDLAYSDIIAGPYYYIAVVRNGTVLSLQVNDLEFADSRSDFPGDPIVRATYNDAPWVLGSLRSTFTGGHAFFSDGGSRWALYDAALTYTRRLAHYEAALNSLSLAGFSNATVSAVLYSDVEPDPISFPFRHNWRDDLIERISFKSGISTARKGYEQANAQRIKPRREIEINQMLKDDYERRMFRAKLKANQHRKWFIPILEDRERLAVPVLSGVQVIPTDTQYKDYELGGYVGLRQLSDVGKITQWEELLISGLEVDEVQTVTATVNFYTNPEVYPVRRAIISESQSLRGHTDAVEDTTVLARLAAEDEKTIPHRITAWTPDLIYKFHEVFNPVTWQSHDWSETREYEVDRTVERVDFEVGPFVVESDSLAADESFTYRMVLEGKDTHAALLGWFYARAGSLNYLWVPTMQRNFAIVSAVSDALTVEGHNYFDNFSGSEFLRDIAFVYHDNTMSFRRIQSVSLDGANEVLDLDASVPTLTNLRSVSYLLFCRLDSDTLEIARITDSKARFAWRFRTMLSSPE